MRIKDILVLQTFRRVLLLLPPAIKRRGSLVLLALLLNSFLDLLGLGAFLPLFSVIGEPELPSSGWMFGYVQFLGITSYAQYVFSLCAFILGIVVFKNLLSLRLNRFIANYSFGLANHLSGQILKLKLALGGNLLQKDNSHKSNWEINVLPGHFVSFVITPLLNLINEMMVLGMILLGLLWYNYVVVVILAGILIPIYFLLYNSTKHKISSMELENAHITPELNALGQLMIFGYADMMVTNSKDYFTKKYQLILDRSMELRSSLFVLKLVPSKIAEIGVIMGAIALMLYGALLTPGAGFITLMGVFAIAAYRLLPSSNRIILALMSVKGYQYTVEVLEDLSGQYKALPAARRIEHNQSVPFTKALELRDIEFHYGDFMPILQGVSLQIKKGEVIGIIGKSGSGKTTLMKILLGFLEAQGGDVFVDGVRLCEENMVAWRDIVGYVAQDVFVMEGSLRENIVFGKNTDEIDEQLLQHVIERSCLGGLVADLPEGLDTQIKENGASLSGGQRQRVGIARAMYSGAQILFFDEATSALDNETEEEINESIRSLMEDDLTILVIAHRYSSLKYCNRIYELSEGAITRELSYNELV